jgi:hypothetical protein
METRARCLARGRMEKEARHALVTETHQQPKQLSISNLPSRDKRSNYAQKRDFQADTLTTDVVIIIFESHERKFVVCTLWVYRALSRASDAILFCRQCNLNKTQKIIKIETSMLVRTKKN